MEFPTTRGPMTPNYGVVLAKQRLTTDSIGNFSLTLTNVVVGSRYSIEVVSTGAQVASGEAAASTVVLSIPAYVSGSANNTLAIKVRKATATPFYRPYDTQTTALVGSAAIYVTQQLDE